MRYLLDTNALLYWLAGSKRITRTLMTKLQHSKNDVYVSAVSAFEIATKMNIGRLTLPEPPGTLLPSFFSESGLTVLPITMEHSFGVFGLPMHHTDPFDRLLISQALHEGMTIVTSDSAFAAYGANLEMIR